MEPFVGAVVVGAIASTILWLIVAILVRPVLAGTLHRLTVNFAVGSFVLINTAILLAALRLEDSGDVIRAVFGTAMGLQLVASMAAVMFVLRARKAH
jgi:hypothetical protein